MAFSNPIAAGNKLVREQLESENFVQGVSGWFIGRDGEAEFNEVAVRGPITVTGIDPDSEITISTALGAPYMQFADVNGVKYQIQASAGPPDASLQIRPLSAPNSGLHFVNGEGIALRSDAVGAPSVLFDDDDGFLKRGSYSPWTEETWHNVPALQNSWAADTSAPQYRVQPDGTVRFRGWLKNGTTAAITNLFTMPAALVPSSNVYFVVAKPNNNTITAIMDVTTGGIVRLIYIGTVATASLSLDSISYSIL